MAKLMKSARGFAVLSALAWSVLATCAKAQNNTVYSGSYSESGTRTDCVAGTTTPWSQSGTFTITVSPALTTLATSGGPVTGSFTFSGSDIGCTTQAVSGQGSVTGVVSAGGGVTLILSETSCSITAQGTIDEVSASLPQACLAHTGTGSLDVSSRATPSNSSPTCIPFPSGFIPFSSIYYVTAANGAGDHLVVGTPAPGALATIDNIPLPAFSNQTFCDSQVQLAPQQYYPSVYVPTADESGGNFAAFNGLLVNPVTNQPYPNGVIPPSQLNQVFAWRIAAAQAASGQPNWTATGSLPESMSMQAAVLLDRQGAHRELIRYQRISLRPCGWYVFTCRADDVESWFLLDRNASQRRPRTGCRRRDSAVCR